MASQVAHIVYAKKYLEKYPSAEIKKDLFFLGSVFPDVRRIDNTIKRKDTHLRFAPLNLDFRGLDSFQAGWKFHLYCDMKRDEILRNAGFYKKIPNVSELPPKLLEDELAYEGYDNWEKLTALLNNPPEIKFDFHVSPESLHLWYAIIARYASQKPNEKSTRAFLVKQASLTNRVDEIMKAVSELKKNKEAVEILENVKNEIV
jgi:hypothetical protein